MKEVFASFAKPSLCTRMRARGVNSYSCLCYKTDFALSMSSTPNTTLVPVATYNRSTFTPASATRRQARPNSPGLSGISHTNTLRTSFTSKPASSNAFRAGDASSTKTCMIPFPSHGNPHIPSMLISAFPRASAMSASVPGLSSRITVMSYFTISSSADHLYAS